MTDGTRGWVFTALAGVPTLLFILTAAVAPGTLGRPVARGTPISLGLVLGLALVVVLILLALVYTRHLNRRDRLLARETTYRS
jgi:uncharacterized membrane protein (DUF485 family)